MTVSLQRVTSNLRHILIMAVMINYSYTIWPSHKDITECKLFVGLMGMPEMFFAEIKPCPRGYISNVIMIQHWIILIFQLHHVV